MKKVLFCFIALIFLSFAGLAEAPKYELYKPYTLTRRQYLQIKLDQLTNATNLIQFGKIYLTALVYPDKIEYNLFVDAKISSDEVKMRKNNLVELTNELTGRFSWSKGMPVVFEETQLRR